MFQNNPLLTQLKKYLNKKKPRIEGIVKSTERGFGFLEIDVQTSYFIPAKYMKKVMHGDKIQAVIKVEHNREIAQPEKLIDSFLKNFVGKIEKKDNHIFIIPDYPYLKTLILCKADKKIFNIFQTGDWVIAKLISHKLRGDQNFSSEIIEKIIQKDDALIPWWVTLARHQLDRHAPLSEEKDLVLKENYYRQDLTHLNFITIDNKNTKDIDDALFIEEVEKHEFLLTIAIADPTAYIEKNSRLDHIALNRSFTNYLPGLNIPMLPRDLSENICSLNCNEKRPVLACKVHVFKDGSICKKVNFFLAWIKSKAKLSYEHVSDWIEFSGPWIPPNQSIKNQILLLYNLCLIRLKWRAQNAVLFQDACEYRFNFSETGEILDVYTEKRRIAHKIIEEAMIIANISGAHFLSKNLGYGIYNIHTGFDHANAEHAVLFLKNHHLSFQAKDLTTLKGFCNLRRVLNILSNNYIENRIRKLQSFGELSLVPGPHFALGFSKYATWTSPIRKYSDMINHRLLKSILTQTEPHKPQEELKLKIIEQKRKNRIAEREVSDWLYTIFLQKKENRNKIFKAEITDVTRNGLRARLIENGANVFIPKVFLHVIREEITFNQDTGEIFINNQMYYRITDVIDVIIFDIKSDTRNIIAKIKM